MVSPDLVDHIAALPESAATGSRDFGRGYAQAIRDVLALLEGSEVPATTT